MMNNLKFYSSLPEVDMNTIVNFEVKDYVPLYIHGSEAYRNEDFQSVIGYIEESLDELLKEEEECRAFCEGPFDQGWFPDFVSSISNHFTFCLKCKQKCSSRLSSLNGEVHSDLLPSHYHFLQFAYYKVKNLQKACEAVSSYLLFFPNDETMLSNKKFYLTMPKVKPEYFTPRKEAINYIKRQQYEEALLNYIEKEFTFEDASDNEVSPSDSKKGNSSHSINISRTNLESGGGRSLFPPLVVKFEWKYRTLYKKEHITQTNNENKNYLVGNNYNNTIMSDKLSITTKKIQLSDEHTLKWRKMRAVKKIKKISERKVTVIMGENELNGKRRFVADGFSQERECQVMLELSKIAAVEGDGYSGNISPHTSSERFEGVTLGRAALGDKWRWRIRDKTYHVQNVPRDKTYHSGGRLPAKGLLMTLDYLPCDKPYHYFCIYWWGNVLSRVSGTAPATSHKMLTSLLKAGDCRSIFSHRPFSVDAPAYALRESGKSASLQPAGIWTPKPQEVLELQPHAPPSESPRRDSNPTSTHRWKALAKRVTFILCAHWCSCDITLMSYDFTGKNLLQGEGCDIIQGYDLFLSRLVEPQN
uniref:Leprecan-like alpha-helical domain-containing protein n=1 Tax=Timema genevievae TaxID=629358 RepID=A0A7R9PLR3_TIMGE|nr:unnamed protein product [Timema genevievae]